MKLVKERQAVTKKPRGTGSRKKAVNGGTAKMKAAANKTLKDYSEEIAVSLLNGTLKGNAAIAKLLIELANGKADCEDEAVVQRCRSLAEDLASEPKWVGEASEAEQETGLKERETES